MDSVTDAATMKEQSKAPAPSLAGPELRIAELEVTLGPNVLRLQAPVHLRGGRLYVLWGPSGSGKSSFVRALLGLGELASPRIAARGEATLTDSAGVEWPLWQGESYNPAARRQIAFLPQSDRLGFIDGLGTLENLRLLGQLLRESAKVQAEHLAARFHLMKLPDKLAHASGGERMRLSAVRALLKRGENDPPPTLVIADEPTAGLDVVAARSLARELIDYAQRKDSIVVVITHDPQVFTGQEPPETGAHKTVHMLECDLSGDEAKQLEIGKLKIEAGRPANPLVQAAKNRFAEMLAMIGGAVLAPLAFLWGLARIKRPLYLLRKTLADAGDPGTHLFSWLGSLLIGGTVAYFIFEQLPRPELVEPLLLEEILQATGHTLVRVVLPLGAAALITGKLGAAQAARLASSVRGGALETLALARWPVESFGLVPAVLAQTAAIAVATVVACYSGVALAALIYVAGHEGASLGLALQLMSDGLDYAPRWQEFLLAKVLASGFVGGSLAAMFGLAPANTEDDVAKAVHRTLLWAILAVITVQCAFIVWEFAQYR
ncbi:MAG: ABC transporter permease [Planctomycetes bacterium]|nr:ABC transporter permease [Planctomycetota bacterium]MCW8134348.1 ABC transporter permease [Planctomycetota bacterium]